jgi:EAL domain-containing protein (putative c-di-GMP-specific phosphodiesterase class I)
LHRALEEKSALSVAYQPQIDLASGSLAGLEALVRWHDPALGEVSPTEFIALAEQGGLIGQLGDFVLDTVIAQIKAWRDSALRDVAVSVNIAPEQLWHADFEDDLLRRIEQADIPANRLLLEITERTAMKDPEGLIGLMNSLRAHGIEFSIDDFGTGFSSLAYLQRFPLRQLKIDMSFVQDLGRGTAGEKICRSVLKLAHTLGLEVVAEGVETDIQAALLRDWGCEIGQGFLFARPLTPAALADWVDSLGAEAIEFHATGGDETGSASSGPDKAAT